MAHKPFSPAGKTYPHLAQVMTASLGYVREKASQGFGKEGVKAFLKDHVDFPDESVVCMNPATGQMWVLRNEAGQVQVWDTSKDN